MLGCCVGSDLHVAEFVSYLSRGVVSTDDFLESSRRAQVRLSHYKRAPLLKWVLGVQPNPSRKKRVSFGPKYLKPQAA